jgi:hypothetical protein
MEVETRKAGWEDLDRCALVLGDAFANYPWTQWTVDPSDHQSRIVGLQRLSLEHFGLACGEVWVTTEDGVISSVVAWTDSARTEVQQLDRAIHAATATLEGSRHEASLAAEQQMARCRLARRHYYLGVVGTVTSQQGRGFGARTIGPLLAKADRDNMEIVLETSSASNVSWYSRLGFGVLEKVKIDGDGPDVWVMLRPPNR